MPEVVRVCHITKRNFVWLGQIIIGNYNTPHNYNVCLHAFVITMTCLINRNWRLSLPSFVALRLRRFSQVRRHVFMLSLDLI